MNKKLTALFDALCADTRDRATCVLRLPGEERDAAIVAGRDTTPPIPGVTAHRRVGRNGIGGGVSQDLRRSRDHQGLGRAAPGATIYQTTDHRYPANTLTCVEVEQRFGKKDIGYFWAIRGGNVFIDYDALFVLGAPEIDRMSWKLLAEPTRPSIQSEGGP